MARPLTRRLVRQVALPYVAVFVVILAIFASVVHTVVQVLQERELSSELDSLARAGVALVEREDGRFSVAEGAANLTGPNATIEWFDEAGKRVAVRGSLEVPPAPLQPGRVRWHGESVISQTLRIDYDGRPIGYMRASISDEQNQRAVRWIDVGLVVGLILAAALSAAGGWYLSRRSVAQIAANVRALEDFSANAAHELRTPVAAVRANAEVTLREGNLSEKDQARLDTIIATAVSMQHLIDDLLLLTIPGTRQSPAQVDLEEVVQSVARDASTAGIPRSVSLEVVVDGEPIVRGNAIQLARVAANLVDNAVRASPPGGVVKIHAWSDRGTAYISVTDHGAGIAKEDMPRIFERFWRADRARRAGEGWGLGLAIVDLLVRRHGGNVSVASAPDRGTIFTVTLPVARRSTA